MRLPHRTLCLLLLSSGILTGAPVGVQAATPAAWPFDRLQLGMRDDEGGAAALRRQTRLGLRYHYLSGGANTGKGWSTWTKGGGSFASSFIDDSAAHDFLPVFSLYHLRESAPGNGMDEVAGFFANLDNRATMTAYLKDARLFFQKAGETGRAAVLHVEPDLWGYVQRRAAGGTRVPVQVATTGLAEAKGLPNAPAGLAQAFVRLRDKYAPKVLLGYHLSVWGTGEDIADSDPSDTHIDELAASATGFYRSLGAHFDLIFAEQDDRDSGYSEARDGDGGRSRWDAGDYTRQARLLRGVSSATGRSVVLWQLPLGNAAQDNTPKHYRDTRVQALLGVGTEAGALRRSYMHAGVIAMLFGKALPDATCACDDDGDGKDDDGGLFKRLADAVRDAGAPALPSSGSTRPSTGAPQRTTAPSVIVKAAAVRRRVRRGSTARFVVRVTSREVANVVVAVQLYRPGAGRTPTYQMAFRGQRLRAGTPRSYRVGYRLPAAARTGRWKVKVGLFDPNFKRLLVWRPNAAAFIVVG
jgi:hypothetical protein